MFHGLETIYNAKYAKIFVFGHGMDEIALSFILCPCFCCFSGFFGHGMDKSVFAFILCPKCFSLLIVRVTSVLLPCEIKERYEQDSYLPCVPLVSRRSDVSKCG